MIECSGKSLWWGFDGGLNVERNQTYNYLRTELAGRRRSRCEYPGQEHTRHTCVVDIKNGCSRGSGVRWIQSSSGGDLWAGAVRTLAVCYEEIGKPLSGSKQEDRTIWQFHWLSCRERISFEGSKGTFLIHFSSLMLSISLLSNGVMMFYLLKIEFRITSKLIFEVLQFP